METNHNINPSTHNGSGAGQHSSATQENKSLQEGYGSHTQGFHPAAPGNYSPPQGNYPPSQGNYPPPQGNYPPPQGNYPAPPQGPYPPTQGGYGPPQPGYGQPPQGGYQPQPGMQGGYGPPQGGYQPPHGGQGPPITNQPMGPGGMMPTNEWMRMPQGVPNCPPGLEYLTMIDHLLVQQRVELLQAISGFETENKYTVHNSLGQKVYYATEMSDSRLRNWCGSLRPFEIKVLDNFGNQVMNLKRPLACKWCCFPCCLQSLEVSAPPGNVVGVIEQEWGILYPKFSIKNPSGDVVLRIEGPMLTMACCSDVDFKVLSVDGSNQVGKISKQWAGYVKEAYTVADNFGISFPMDLDVRMKAVMLGACFLIDMMYYEERPSTNDSNTNRTTQPQQPNQPPNQQPTRPV
ncbi:hypothetical protein ILUMI_08667 [Ignelater luminosus]|uniref:Phospholipid scramblase n=1 Tax=Ignelater luminosus TaxID=2038154 RepID=A0A8K0GFR3_IGNLU|nr:hypothetical protein ILUMI_08667 [Ignelater luminosus]